MKEIEEVKEFAEITPAANSQEGFLTSRTPFGMTVGVELKEPALKTGRYTGRHTAQDWPLHTLWKAGG